MGAEARCKVRHGGQVAAAKALLETDEVVIRGDLRITIPLRDVTAATALDGALHLTWPGGPTVLELGAQAARWANRIRSPRGRLDKLGIKPGQSVAVLGVDDPEFLDELARRLEHYSTKASKEHDVIFLSATDAAALDRLPRLKASLKRDGALWVVRPKGKGAEHISEKMVMAAGKAAGLVDVKVVRFSETHTAEKFVIPVASR
jgi:hypothetical protein